MSRGRAAAREFSPRELRLNANLAATLQAATIALLLALLDWAAAPPW